MAAASSSLGVKQWVDDVAKLTKPDQVYWCTGSEEEYQNLASQMVKDGSFFKLNPKTYPNSYLHRSDPSDVARLNI